MEKIDRKSLLLPVRSERDLAPALEKAKKTLLAGGIIAFPTESFYGLAVNALDEQAIQRLFNIKKRERTRPLLILIPRLETLNRYVENIPDIASRLIKNFWPGGLTLLFNATPEISPLLTAGTGKIGIRLSSHSIATGLAGSINGPITGTSANISGKPAPVEADDVYKSLGTDIDLIIDGGKTKGGEGSTILDITCDPALVLREGMIKKEDLEKYYD